MGLMHSNGSQYLVMHLASYYEELPSVSMGGSVPHKKKMGVA